MPYVSAHLQSNLRSFLMTNNDLVRRLEPMWTAKATDFDVVLQQQGPSELASFHRIGEGLAGDLREIVFRNRRLSTFLHSSQYWWLSTPSPAEKLHNGPNGGSPAETLHNGPNGGTSSSGVVPRQSQAESTELDASIIFFTQFGCCKFFCCKCSRVQY
eukprot:COSAG02_NODE_2396_length_8953_cov_12.894850_7_plen_158_part_00